MSDRGPKGKRGARAPTDQRRAWIGRVHGAAATLGLDDDTRRALQLQVTGVESCARMSLRQLLDVMEALYQRGYPRPTREPMVSVERRPLVAKLKSQCEAQGYPWPAYVLGISRRMFGEAAPTVVAWHTPQQLRKLVAALTYDQRRRPKPAPGPVA
jgi:phage gp16-like protein